MEKIKHFFIYLIKNPVKAFLVTAIINIAILGRGQLFVVLGLPEIANESDNLSDSQVLVGFFLSILSLILGFLSLIFSPLFTISLIYFVYRIIKPSTKLSK